MAEVIILGSANSIPDERHENAHLAIVGQQEFILVDCVGTPIVRLQQAGLDFKRLRHLVLTHFHPDHVSGVPLLLMNMWLLGRRQPLFLYGLEYTLTRVKWLMDAYGWQTWPDFFPVHFCEIAEQPLAPVVETEEFRLWASPVEHLIPTIGLRVEAADGGVLAYSCDTQPTPSVVELARGADVLIHEATGEAVGHSSARQAGEIAQEAAVRRLYLIHYDVRSDPHALIPQARQTFQGEVALAEDFLRLTF
ncbi:MAG: MBL fold metallo-hydrolase [Anaerolineae bacterium]|nr:MAG: MBL fold metallo-hydrolase [Anaerolineae bacterium]